MVILPSTRTETTAVAVTPGDPRCQAIAQRYGEQHQMYMAVADGEPKADTPSMVMMMKTYGPDTIKKQLSMRMRFSVLKMDAELLNDEEIDTIASGIADDPNARILGYDLVLGFFRSLERSEFELYSCKPRHIMSAWQQYARTALQVMHRLKEAAERKRRDEEWENHSKQCITLAEFKRRQQAT